jgi:hypothetical protein
LPPHIGGGQWLCLKRRKVEDGMGNGIVFERTMGEMVEDGDGVEG